MIHSKLVFITNILRINISNDSDISKRIKISV